MSDYERGKKIVEDAWKAEVEYKRKHRGYKKPNRAPKGLNWDWLEKEEKEKEKNKQK